MKKFCDYVIELEKYIGNEENYIDDQYEYDPDSSLYAWEVYRCLNWEHNNNSNMEYWKIFKLDELESHTQKGYTRMIAIAVSEKKYLNRVELGGDTIFNFNEKHIPDYENKIRAIDDIDKKNLCDKKLDFCKKMHHSLLNFSVMLRTGGMNSFKGIKNDRFDQFICNLEKYYTERNEKDLPRVDHRNEKCLKAYLDLFNSFKEYIKEIYFLDTLEDEEFIKALKNSGEKDYIEDVEGYMDLAIKYWMKKKVVFEKFKIEI